MRVISFILDDSQVNWLRLKKSRYGVSMSMIVREALDDEIRNEQRFGETQYFKTQAEKVHAIAEEHTSGKE